MRWTSELTPSELKRIKEVETSSKSSSGGLGCPELQYSAGTSGLLAVPSPRQLLGPQCFRHGCCSADLEIFRSHALGVSEENGRTGGGLERGARRPWCE